LKVHVAGWLGTIALSFDEARLQRYDIFSQLVILRLNLLEVLVQELILAYLLFELLDVAFFALAECSLRG
jgi:hypothetical protein